MPDVPRPTKKHKATKEHGRQCSSDDGSDLPPKGSRKPKSTPFIVDASGTIQQGPTSTVAGSSSSTSTAIVPVDPHDPKFNARRFFRQHFTLSASESIIRSSSVGNVLKQLMRNHAEGGALLETMLTMFEEGQLISGASDDKIRGLEVQVESLGLEMSSMAARENSLKEALATWKASFDAKVAEEVEKARQEAVRAANERVEEKVAAEVGKYKDVIATERDKFSEEKAALTQENENLNATVRALNGNLTRLQDNEVLFGLDGFKKCKKQVYFLMKSMASQGNKDEVDGLDMWHQLGFCKEIVGDHLEGPDDEDSEDENAETSQGGGGEDGDGEGGNADEGGQE